MEYVQDRGLYEISEGGESKAKLAIRAHEHGIAVNAHGRKLSADGRHFLFAISEEDASELKFIKDDLLAKVPSHEELVNQRLYAADHQEPVLKTKEELEAYKAEMGAKEAELNTEVTKVQTPTITSVREENPASVALNGKSEGYLDEDEGFERLGSATWGYESLVLKIRGSAPFVFTPAAFSQFVEFAKTRREHQMSADDSDQAFLGTIENISHRSS